MVMGRLWTVLLSSVWVWVLLLAKLGCVWDSCTWLWCSRWISGVDWLRKEIAKSNHGFSKAFLLSLSFFKVLFIWERVHARANEHGGVEWGQREREKQTPCWVGSLTWGSIPEPREQDLSQRQMLDHLSYAGAPAVLFLIVPNWK